MNPRRPWEPKPRGRVTAAEVEEFMMRFREHFGIADSDAQAPRRRADTHPDGSRIDPGPADAPTGQPGGNDLSDFAEEAYP